MGRDGSGVSVSMTASGRWRVRWRDADGRQKERTYSTEAEARRAHAAALTARDEGEAWVAPTAAAARVTVREPATLAGIMAGWLSARRASGRVTANTMKALGVRSARALRAVRGVLGLDPNDPIPASLLTRKLALDLVGYIPGMRDPALSVDAVIQTVTTLLDAWDWAMDDVVTYAGVPIAPRDRTTILPLPPTRTAPVAPTLAEVDAAIRRMHGRALVLAVIQRFTALRIDQTQAIEVRDLDLDRRTLYVRTGKSKREKLGRVVPISPHLAAFLRDHIERVGLSPEDRVGQRHGSQTPDGAYGTAWEAATLAGEARRETWAPPGRLRRPTHAIRAAVLSHLDAAGTPGKVLSHLAGHAEEGADALRAGHYVSPDVERSRPAVDSLPPIDWSGTWHEGKVLSMRGRRRTA